ncbi:hypothetical protein [Microbispora sp. NPDC049125]|uniref:hypothetical protein n=1 Tax=Microbispora sp. NPDC049125 TaxID=3154929 RepID=UPI0034651952
MTMTEADLRGFLAQDSSEGVGREVTVADVDHRVRRIRRRRLATGAALVAGLSAAAAVAVAPSGSTSLLPDDVWTASAMARPSATPSVAYLESDRVLADETVATGGRKEPIPYARSHESVSVSFSCGEASYAFLWLGGVLVDQGPCGIQDDHVDRMLHWAGADGDGTGRGTVEVAVVPAGSVPGGGLPGGLTSDEADRLVAGVGEYPARAHVIVTEAFTAFRGGRPAQRDCHGDVVIQGTGGQPIHSSVCEAVTEASFTDVPFPGTS